MPNTIDLQTLSDGPLNLVVKVKITGDGSGDEVDRILINISEYEGPLSEVRIVRILPSLRGFSVTLSWDADANVKIIDILSDDSAPLDYCHFGGLPNNAGVGKTGDILLTTRSLNNGDEGTLVLEMKKVG